MKETQGKAIRRALEDKGISLAEIGRRCGVSRNHVSQVVAGKRESGRIRQAITKALGFNPWSERRSGTAA